MQNRRDFLKTAAFAALGPVWLLTMYLQGKAPRLCSISIKVV